MVKIPAAMLRKSDVSKPSEGVLSKMLVREYLTVLPAEEQLAAELEKTQRMLERRIGHHPDQRSKS